MAITQLQCLQCSVKTCRIGTRRIPPLTCLTAIVRLMYVLRLFFSSLGEFYFLGLVFLCTSAIVSAAMLILAFGFYLHLFSCFHIPFELLLASGQCPRVLLKEIAFE